MLYDSNEQTGRRPRRGWLGKRQKAKWIWWHIEFIHKSTEMNCKLCSSNIEWIVLQFCHTRMKLQGSVTSASVMPNESSQCWHFARVIRKIFNSSTIRWLKSKWDLVDFQVKSTSCNSSSVKSDQVTLDASSSHQLYEPVILKHCYKVQWGSFQISGYFVTRFVAQKKEIWNLGKQGPKKADFPGFHQNLCDSLLPTQRDPRN